MKIRFSTSRAPSTLRSRFIDRSGRSRTRSINHPPQQRFTDTCFRYSWLFIGYGTEEHIQEREQRQDSVTVLSYESYGGQNTSAAILYADGRGSLLLSPNPNTVSPGIGALRISIYFFHHPTRSCAQTVSLRTSLPAKYPGQSFGARLCV